MVEHFLWSHSMDGNGGNNSVNDDHDRAVILMMVAQWQWLDAFAAASSRGTFILIKIVFHSTDAKLFMLQFMQLK